MQSHFQLQEWDSHWFCEELLKIRCFSSLLSLLCIVFSVTVTLLLYLDAYLVLLLTWLNFVSHGEQGNLFHSRYTPPNNLILGNPQPKELLGRRAALCYCTGNVRSWCSRRATHFSWFPGSSSASVQSRFVSKIPGRTPLLQSQPGPRGWASLFLLTMCNDIHHLLHELSFQNMCHGEVRQDIH